MNLEEQIKETLKGVNYPGYSRDIVSFGLVKGVAAANGSAGIDLELTTHNPEVAAQLKAECEAAVKVLDGIERAFAVKAPKATTTGSENYLGVAHCASEGEVVHGWLTASKSILLLATEKREEEEEEKEKVAEEESSMIKTKFRAMESVVARWRMNPLLNEETGKSEVVRKALANAAGMRDAF